MSTGLLARTSWHLCRDGGGGRIRAPGLILMALRPPREHEPDPTAEELLHINTSCCAARPMHKRQHLHSPPWLSLDEAWGRPFGPRSYHHPEGQPPRRIAATLLALSEMASS